MVLQQPEKIARRSKAVRGVEGTEQAWRRYCYRWVVAVTKVRDAARFDFKMVACAQIIQTGTHVVCKNTTLLMSYMNTLSLGYSVVQTSLHMGSHIESLFKFIDRMIVQRKMIYYWPVSQG